MIIKMESDEMPSNKNIPRKLRCPHHDGPYLFKCEYALCQFPFICSSVHCIGQHSHEDKIIMSKFNPEHLANKFIDVQQTIQDDSLQQKTKVIRSHVDNLKESVNAIERELKKTHKNYDYFKSNLNQPLNFEYLKKVQENYELNQELKRSLDSLKNKIRLEFPLKDDFFQLKNPLISFMLECIPTFKWTSCLELYSSKNQLIACERFHEKLHGLHNLLFIFIGESRIVGSYFTCSYPTLTNRSKKDLNSFIFINKSKYPTQFIRYNAVQAEQHISISEKTYICQGNTPSYGDGIRTFHKNFDALEFCLPTNTYACLGEETTQSGTLKVKKFMVLQVGGRENVVENGHA